MLKTNSYIIDYAKSFGPISAIFINLLSNYNSQLENGDIVLSRQEIYNYTGLNDSDQMRAESFLTKIGIIKVKSFKGNDLKNHYFLDESKVDALKEKTLDNLSTMFGFDAMSLSTSDKNTKNVFTERQKKESKKDQLIKSLKSSINVEDSVLRQYLCDWIDSVIERGNTLTRSAVKLNIENLKNFTTDPELAIKVLKIAIINGWRDLYWAIEKVKPIKKSSVSGNNFANYSDIKGTKNNLMDEAF